MKLSFTKKLILDSVDTEDDVTRIQFVSYLKEDYIERLVRISVKNNTVVNMYFSSNDYGTASWVAGRGVVDSHKWETEDDLKSTSYLSKHYPTLLEDGKVSDEFALKHIIPDVLDNMVDENLSTDLFRTVMSPDAHIVFKWDEIIKKNKALSDDFISTLIAEYESQVKELDLTEGRQAEIIDNNKNYKKFKAGLAKPNILKNPIRSISAKFIPGKSGTADNTGKSPENRGASGKNSTRAEDARDYLERARELAKRIKKI
jgi:hypothetical protein